MGAIEEPLPRLPSEALRLACFTQKLGSNASGSQLGQCHVQGNLVCRLRIHPLPVVSLNDSVGPDLTPC